MFLTSSQRGTAHRALRVSWHAARRHGCASLALTMVWSRYVTACLRRRSPDDVGQTVQVFRSKQRTGIPGTPDLPILPDVAIVDRVAPDSREIVDYFILSPGEKRNIFIGSAGKTAHDWAERYRYGTFDQRASAASKRTSAPARMSAFDRNTGRPRRR